jgi:glutaredoxin
MMRAAVLVATFLASSIVSAQQLYRWTDEKGRVHVTDTPPPPSAKAVQKKTTPGAAASGAAESPGNEPYVLQLARKNNPVTLYTTPACEPCGEARRLLNARGVPFKEVSVIDEKQVEEMKKAVGGSSVPSLVVGETLQNGFEEAAYHRVLDAAGYPKTGMLPPRKQGEPKAAEPQAEAKPAPQEETPRGPYAPGAPPQRSQKK